MDASGGKLLFARHLESERLRFVDAAPPAAPEDGKRSETFEKREAFPAIGDDEVFGVTQRDASKCDLPDPSVASRARNGLQRARRAAGSGVYAIVEHREIQAIGEGIAGNFIPIQRSIDFRGFGPCQRANFGLGHRPSPPTCEGGAGDAEICGTAGIARMVGITALMLQDSSQCPIEIDGRHQRGPANVR